MTEALHTPRNDAERREVAVATVEMAMYKASNELCRTYRLASAYDTLGINDKVSPILADIHFQLAKVCAIAQEAAHGARRSWDPTVQSDADDAIREAMAADQPVDEGTARLIASWWHGGQWTAFTSTGTIKDGLLDEIAECYPDAGLDDCKRLDALTHYVRHALAP